MGGASFQKRKFVVGDGEVQWVLSGFYLKRALCCVTHSVLADCRLR